METKLQVGDVVKLKSGGPLMTIAQYPYIKPIVNLPPDYSKAQCVWFEGDKKNKDVFNILTLIRL